MRGELIQIARRDMGVGYISFVLAGINELQKKIISCWYSLLSYTFTFIPFQLYSICRLAITISGVVIKILCMPCRKLLGASSPHYNGHMPISTVDYGYRGDPYKSNANAGFELQ